MKLISWNVNGLRACMGKGFLDFFNKADADMFCIQETKMQPGQLELELEGYHQYWCSAQKKGYSGTALFTKEEPISVRYGIGIEEHDMEGRVITAEFPEYFVVFGKRLYAQFPAGPDPPGLPYGVGGCVFVICPTAGGKKAGNHLRRYECGPSGN